MFDYKRTYNCATLTKKNISEKVTLSGWVNRRRDHGGLIFIDLRDRFGITQLVFDPKIAKQTHQEASSLRSEWVISIIGKVIPRAEGMCNPKLKTGEIEIEVEKINILSKALTPPFPISDNEAEINEEIRLKYRYLDIRKGVISRNLILRHEVMQAVRNFLSSENFIEVTTPTFCKSTPEGARDYLVPSRVYPGNFYALPQSPQMFKQLLMIAGIDRYFQIAQCFRDEDLRADRQPEFTQIDMEMSFEKPGTLFNVCENMMKTIFKSCVNVEIKTPFLRLTHKEALEKYGSDKPDVRFDMILHRLDDIIAQSHSTILKNELSSGGCAKSLCIKGGADISRKQQEELSAFAAQFGLPGISFMKKTNEGFSSNIVKFFSDELLKKLQHLMQIENNDMIIIAAGKENEVNQTLDQLRRLIAKTRNLISPNAHKFLWVTDFPMFAIDLETNEIAAEHHPFTSPNFDDLHLMEKDPLKVRAIAYDLVLNGYEMASGSQRIHDSDLQRKIFQLLKLSEKELDDRFGFFIEALKYGTPPHLGCALGLDRIVMVLANTDNIRDVIAFPKNQKACDLMQRTPSEISDKHLKELHIKIEKPEKINWV